MARDARPDDEERALSVQAGSPAQTIFALSSGAPPAAIAVVRISGPKAHAALETFAGTLPPPRVARLARLVHGGDLLDQALVLRFDAPRSETGEDVVELQLHGGRSVVAAVLAALGTMEGLRLAQPGEFTRRAFENGRLDLSEAEGLADLLFSETQSQRRAALALAGGALGRQVEAWQSRLLETAARIEAELDFSDEDDVPAGDDGTSNALRALAEEIGAWLARPPIERLRDGLRVVIAGPPNAGKSSLLNILAGRQAAITSAIAGTTRDLVEAPTAIGGTPFLLVDTAGIRDSGADEIEAIGIARARQSLEAADLILWLGAPPDCPCPEKSILVHAKADLGHLDPKAEIAVSAMTGEGIEALVDLLVQRSRTLIPAEGEVAINARHRAALAESEAWIAEAAASADLLVTAEAVRQAMRTLDQVTGRAGVEDMLDNLFGRFCIGK